MKIIIIVSILIIIALAIIGQTQKVSYELGLEDGEHRLRNSKGIKINET